MQNLFYIAIILSLTFNICMAQNKWIWSNQKQRGYPPSARNQYARADRDREPTTKRPLPGQPQNDEIDDYTDSNDEVSKQNSPYLPPGAVGHPLITGNYNGFGNYPQIPDFAGNAPNGILVGPGGPTGIIGRPQTQFPAGAAHPSSFPTVPGGYPGFSVAQLFNGAAVNNNPGFPSYNGLNNVAGQYPFPNVNNPPQFSASQYPQNQFPGVQYPQQPQYTEGYGLANLNVGFNSNPQFNGNFNPNYGFGFDEYPAQAEGKNANFKTFNKKVDDKVTKNLKKI